MREQLHNNAHKGTIWTRVRVGAQTPPRKVGGGRCIVLRIVGVIKLHIMMRERKNRVTPPPPNEMKAKMERTCG